MFNIFKKKKDNNSNSPAYEDWIKAKKLFEKSDYSNSLSTLIDGFRKDIYYKPLYDLASNCLDKMGGQEEGVLFKNASKNLNASSFTELGNHFYNVEHYPLTKIFLEESFKKNKTIEIADKLSIAYARRFNTKKAQETLELVKDKFDFWTFWFYVKMKILNNDQNNLNEYIIQLENAFDPNSQDENLKVPKQKIKELRESYKRLQKIKQVEHKIRDWQYIQYGSVMLDFFYDENQYVAGGRHVASWGNYHSIKSILLRLKEILDAKNISTIVYANNRDSKIIGLTLGKIMNKTSEPYNPTKIYTNSLLLVSDSTGFNEFNNVEDINNNNLTFSFNHNWLQANFICPDIIGLMSQTYSYPWNGGNFTMSKDGTPSKTEPDTREEEIIAQEILAIQIEEETKIDEFYHQVQDELKMNKSNGHRYNFMVESPIPGSYFGSN